MLNRGFGGCQIADCTYYADRIVIPYKPRLIVLRAGGNDIHAGKTPEQVAADFQAFVEKVRAKLPNVRIAYMTINATPSRWKNVERERKANQLIKDYIAKDTTSTTSTPSTPRWALTASRGGSCSQGSSALQRRGLQDPDGPVYGAIWRKRLLKQGARLSCPLLRTMLINILAVGCKKPLCTWSRQVLRFEFVDDTLTIGGRVIEPRRWRFVLRDRKWVGISQAAVLESLGAGPATS